MATRLRKGTVVIEAKSGTRLGRVHAVYLDPKRREIAGITLRHGGIFWRTRPDLIQPTRISRIADDGLVVTGGASYGAPARDPRRTGLVSLDDLTRRPVRLEDGTLLGRIAAVRFCQASCRLAGLEVDPLDQPLCRMLLDNEQIVRISENAVVVRDPAVVAPSRPRTSAPPIDLRTPEPRRVA
jgi:uncharacterized protein YrrD